MSLSTLVKMAELRQQGTLGLVDGAFDLLHPGHVRHLQNCARLCVNLVVLVACDEFVARKGNSRPIIGQDERLAMVSALSCVKYAQVCDGTVAMVNLIKPDVYFKNEDYKLDEDLDGDILLVRMPVYGSTTNLVKRIKKGVNVWTAMG